MKYGFFQRNYDKVKGFDLHWLIPFHFKLLDVRYVGRTRFLVFVARQGIETYEIWERLHKRGSFDVEELALKSTPERVYRRIKNTSALVAVSYDYDDANHRLLNQPLLYQYV